MENWSKQWALVNHWFPLPFLFALWFVFVFVRNTTPRSRSRWRSQHCVTSCRCMEYSPQRAGIVLGTFCRDCLRLLQFGRLPLYNPQYIESPCHQVLWIATIYKPQTRGFLASLTSLKFCQFCRKQCKTSAWHVQLRIPLTTDAAHKSVGKLAAPGKKPFATGNQKLHFLIRKKSRCQRLSIDLSLNLAMLRFSKVEEHLMGENNSSPGTFWAP